MDYEIDNQNYGIKNPDLNSEVTIIIPKIVQAPEPPTPPTPVIAGNYTKIIEPDVETRSMMRCAITSAVVEAI